MKMDATHCTKGHEMTEENTYICKATVGKNRRVVVQKTCKTCCKEYYKANKQWIMKLTERNRKRPEVREQIREYQRAYRERRDKELQKLKRAYQKLLEERVGNT